MSTETQAPWIPSDDALGARLALVRHRMGWNIKEAALACNLPAASWRGWELFGYSPRNLVEVADRIAIRTGVDEYWLLTGKKSPRPGDPGGGETITAERARRDSNPQPSDPKVGPAGVDELTARRVDRERRLRRERRRTIVPATAFAAAS